MLKHKVEPASDSAAAQDHRKVAWIDRGWYVAIEFEMASSGKLDQAIAIAKKNPFFVELVDERGMTWFRAIYFKKDFSKFQELYALAGPWKNTRFFLKGDEVKKDDFETWYACYQQYWGHRKNLNLQDYCGTNKVSVYPDFIGYYGRNIVLRWQDPLTYYAQYHTKLWYTFGKRQGNTFHLDKAAMRGFLKKQNAEYELCPCYGHESIDHYINKLPNDLNPHIHTEWQFKEDFLKITANRAFIHYDITLSMMPEICPVNEKSYEKFMNRIFKES